MGYIQGEGRQQSSLFPPTLEELVPEDYLVRVNDRPGRRPIVTLHSWQPDRLTPTHILLAGLTAQALAGQSRLYRI